MSERNWKEKAASALEEAKKLWGKVSSRGPRPATPLAQSLSSIDGQVEALVEQVRRLEDEAAASYDVVQSIAQQHSNLSEQHLTLVQAVDDLLERNRRLTWTCVGLAALAAASLVAAVIAIAR